MELREYQAEAEASVRVAIGFDGYKAPLVVMATGLGKTVLFSHVAHNWPEGRVMVIAHRTELIDQAARKIAAVTGDYPQIEMADQMAESDGMLVQSNVVVASVQSLVSGRTCKQCAGTGVNQTGDEGSCPACVNGMRRRLQKFNPNEFGLVVIDEAHHAPASSYRTILEYFQRNERVRLLGVTATPDRSDEIAMGSVFDTVAYEYQLPHAIRDGWLVPIRQSWVHVEGLDFSKLKAPGGDFREKDIASLMEQEEELQKVVSATIAEAGDKKTLVFAASVAHAEKMAEIIRRHDLKAECVTGTTNSDIRQQTLKKFERGEIQFLCGCGVFLEGFDEPSIELIAMARPTKSRALYAQAIGRGTRPINPPTAATAEERREAIAASPKPFVHVLDFVGNSGKHKLISTADILAGEEPDEIVEDAIRRAKEKGAGKLDMGEEIRETVRLREEEKRAEEQKRKFLKTTDVRYQKSTVDPFDVLDVRQTREPGWFKGKLPTQAQLNYLQRAGLKDKQLAELSFSQATKLIGSMIARREQGLCTYKQARLLKQHGYSSNTTFKEAQVILGKIFDGKPNWSNRTPQTTGSR